MVADSWKKLGMDLAKGVKLAPAEYNNAKKSWVVCKACFFASANDGRWVRGHIEQHRPGCFIGRARTLRSKSARKTKKGVGRG